jgi:branched-chain amino acid transport system permease protein
MDEIVALFIHGIAQGAVYVLIAVGFSLIYRSTGLLNLAFGEIVMIGSLLGFSAMTLFGLPFWIAIVACVAVAAVLNLGMEVVVLQPILRTGNVANALVAGVGLMIILNQVGLLIWGADPLTYPESMGGGPVKIGPATVSSQSLWIVAMSVVSVVGLQTFMRRTPLGTAMRAVADDRLASQLVGINPRRTAVTTALIAGAMGGMAGVLLGSLYFASYSLSAIGIKGLAAATIGAFGDIRGAIVGGMLVGLVEAYGTVYLPDLSAVLAWVVMIVILLLMPQGILGVAGRRDD